MSTDNRDTQTAGLRPPPEHGHHRWHWLETEFGPMAASWFPMIGDGSWDISGHTMQATNPRAMRELRYIGPAIPPESINE